MSIDLMNRLWWREDLPMTEKFVAIALADAADDHGVCWPAVATIAQKCSCSERTVQNAVKGLCGKGLMRRQERRDQSSYYIFNFDSLPHVDRVRRPKEKHPAAATLTGESPAPDLFGTGESGSMTGESGSMTGESPAPRTIIEPSIETSLDSGDLKSPGLVEWVEQEWHKLKADHPAIADVRKIDDGQAAAIRLRGNQHAVEGETPFDVWRVVFEEIRKSRFLCGRVPPGQGRDRAFKLSLNWLCSASKFRDVINGKFSSDTEQRFSYAGDGSKLGPGDKAAAVAIERVLSRRKRQRGG